MTSMWPVYEIRPIDPVRAPNWNPMPSEWLRWNDGNPIPDDGAWDLAWICENNRMVQGMEVPYQKNILWSWLTTHWSDNVADHPRGNPWHYHLREGESEWGGDWGRDRHPNTRAVDSAMRWLSNRKGSASGGAAEFRPNNAWIVRGLVREKETRNIVVVPSLTCMYCGRHWAGKEGHDGG